MCVFGNVARGPNYNKEDGHGFPMAEAFDASNSSWRPLCIPPSSIDFSKVCGHAVLDDDNNDDSKIILFHSRGDPGLYTYDIGSDSWDIWPKSSAHETMSLSAFVDRRGSVLCG
ncbi:hypothetical protein RHGRI_031195 [Rhododendron griersonianum]|uniref:F-box/kelch-repeat protein n=1 Tax=Rhododendron griersonianum TaxID=479676 RepID=A0AAV6I7H1_9ERIC|nr:hypothetical protein RHGRI_031195 [Rhododendron griersonianum]